MIGDYSPPKFAVGDRVEMPSNDPDDFSSGWRIKGKVKAVYSCRQNHLSAYPRGAGYWAGRQFVYEVDWDPGQRTGTPWSKGGNGSDLVAESLLFHAKTVHTLEIAAGDIVVIRLPGGVERRLELS